MRVTAKRIVRIVVVLLLALLVVYLAIIDARNPQTVILPLFISLPTAWVVAIALLLGFVVGWVSLVSRVLQLRRENRSLRQRLIRAGLETPQSAPAKTLKASSKTRNETTRF